jgi:hypothetical protein
MGHCGSLGKHGLHVRQRRLSLFLWQVLEHCEGLVWDGERLRVRNSHGHGCEELLNKMGPLPKL